MRRIACLVMNCTAAMRFVDTNILLYAVSRSMEDQHKRTVAQQLLAGGDIGLSVQVAQEFFVQAIRPSSPFDMSRGEAARFIDSLAEFPITDITFDIVRDAIAISTRFQLSYWDGAILAAAQSMGCDSVLSEDLSSHQDYNGLRVINPFT